MPVASDPRPDARDVPATSDILCEQCGYRLNGLDESSRCPECGKPIVESLGRRRTPTAWDQSPGAVTFISTSVRVLLFPRDFYQTFITRGPLDRARGFAAIHWLASSILFAIAIGMHAQWYFGVLGGSGLGATGVLVRVDEGRDVDWRLAIVPAVFVLTLGTLYLTTRLAARLTTWEATYRGYRLPIDVVLRGMYYHAAHYLPVAILTCATVVGFIGAIDRGLLAPRHLTTYLYTLSAEVVVSAGYLFSTYWTAMRNMMYANR